MIYVTGADAARKVARRLCETITDYEPRVGLDIETAPAVDCVGYPGTRWVLADDSPVKANRDEYLRAIRVLALRLFGLEYTVRTVGIGMPSAERLYGPAKQSWATVLEALSRATADDVISQAEFWQEYGNLEQRLTALQAEKDQLDQRYAEIAESTEKGASKERTKVKAARKAAEKQIEQLSSDWAILQDSAKCVVTERSLPLLKHLIGVSEYAKDGAVDPIQPGLDPFTTDIFLVQFTFKRKDTGELESYVFNAFEVPLELLKPLLTLPVTYLGANIKFDLKHLLYQIGSAPENVWCSRVASRVMSLGLRRSHSLAEVVQRYLGRDVSKEVRSQFIGKRWEGEVPAELLEYAAFDTEILFELHDVMSDVAAQRGQTELVEVFSRLSYPTAVTELLGFCLDIATWNEYAVTIKAKRDQLAQQIEELLLLHQYRAVFGAESTPLTLEDDEDPREVAVVRVSQRAIVAELLSEILGLEVTSLAKDARSELETEYLAKNGTPHPFFAYYNQWSKLAKQASTYGDTFLRYVHPFTGRVHPNLTIAGTDTGRFTSTAPNVLNIPTPKDDDPVDFRQAFRAPPGYRFQNADYSSMELRIAADVTHDPNLIGIFATNGDPHTITAILMFHLQRAEVSEPTYTTQQYNGVPIEVAKVPAEWPALGVIRWIVTSGFQDRVKKQYGNLTRKAAKSVSLGYMFGMSAHGIARKQNISLDEAKLLFNTFEQEAYPLLSSAFRQFGERPYRQAIFDVDRKAYGYSEGYLNIRRYFRRPEAPRRTRYATDEEYTEAEEEFRKQKSAIRRQAKNVPTQGGNAVITAIAVSDLARAGKNFRSFAPKQDTLEGRLGIGIFPLLSIYDEVLALVPTSVPERISTAVLVQAMQEPSERFIRAVDSVVDPNPPSEYWTK